MQKQFNVSDRDSKKIANFNAVKRKPQVGLSGIRTYPEINFSKPYSMNEKGYKSNLYKNLVQKNLSKHKKPYSMNEKGEWFSSLVNDEYEKGFKSLDLHSFLVKQQKNIYYQNPYNMNKKGKNISFDGSEIVKSQHQKYYHMNEKSRKLNNAFKKEIVKTSKYQKPYHMNSSSNPKPVIGREIIKNQKKLKFFDMNVKGKFFVVREKSDAYKAQEPYHMKKKGKFFVASLIQEPKRWGYTSKKLSMKLDDIEKTQRTMRRIKVETNSFNHSFKYGNYNLSTYNINSLNTKK